MSSARMMDTTSKIKTSLQVILGGHAVAACLATYWGNETWYNNFLMPTVRLLFDAETSHRLAISMAKYGFMPRVKVLNYRELESNVLGLNFKSPIGLAAGFDKDGVAINGLSKIGLSFIEIGSVTPIAQEGNSKPRVFRLAKDMAIINRYGFNSAGHDDVYHNLQSKETNFLRNIFINDDRNLLNENFYSPLKSNLKSTNIKKACPFILGINLGKNRESPDPINDFIDGIKKFSQIADYLVINLSSPNTPGLRKMQNKMELEKLLNSINEYGKTTSKLPPILIKISPDLSMQEKKDIATIVVNNKHLVSGLVISNTSTSRPESLKSEHKVEVGGLSGLPIKELSTKTIQEFYMLTEGTIPIIGVGGVFTGLDAYEKMRHGASLVQIYTSLTYQGPPVVAKINKELHELLVRDGYNNISEIIGIDAETS